jgi:hypothetical protein
LYQSGELPRKLRAKAWLSVMCGMKIRGVSDGGSRQDPIVHRITLHYQLGFAQQSPYRFSTACLVYREQRSLVRLAFSLGWHDDDQRATSNRRNRKFGYDTCGVVLYLIENESPLAARHREINVQQDLGVEQGSMQLAARIVDGVALAQCIETVALTRMHAPRERQRIENVAQPRDLADRPGQSPQLGIEKRNVERSVVNDELRATDELDQLIDDVRKARLLREKFVGDAVNLQRAPIDFSIRPEIAMERATGLAPIEDFHATYFDHSMALLGLETCGFGVEDDLAHGGMDAVGGLAVSG